MEEGLEVTTDPDPCEWSVKYRSVVGRGVAEILEDGPVQRAGLDIVVKAFAGRTLDFPGEGHGRAGGGGAGPGEGAGRAPVGLRGMKKAPLQGGFI
ncbi:MAG: hypothetical protein M0C28_00025 [Candidatus Moduliflexus flocculans]|nr:hypothetical protein [Candidatus Moduliflexus flocculans]